MKTINSILESGHLPEQQIEVPKYVHEGRLIKLGKRKIERSKFPKTKISKQKTLSYKKISDKKFMSFINTEYEKAPESSPEAPKIINMYSIMQSVETDLKELIELSKIEDEDVYYGLIDLKEKELGLIYNYIKKNR